MKRRSHRRARVLTMLSPLATLACGTLIGLGDLEKADCVDCAAGASGGVSGGGVSPGSGGSELPTAGSAISTAGSGGGAGNSVGGTLGSGGALAISGGPMVYPIGGDASEGLGGAAPNLEVCTGGPEPPLDWKEHWFEHTEALKRVYYDDCIALYFDSDMPAQPKDWLVPFLDASWAYSLATYGKVGGERLFIVVHQGKYHGGHAALHDDPAHDFRNVIDMGSNDWPAGDYDLPAHLMAFVVDYAGAHTKLGAPKAQHYGNVGFPLIFKYDLYLALGLNDVAAGALAYFNTLSSDQPYPDTYWFRDWFYPLWRDHGRAKVFANYQILLEKYYPADSDNWMPTMNYGQYFHFMSGAAGQDLEPLAREAFDWNSDFDTELAAAKQDFSGITY